MEKLIYVMRDEREGAARVEGRAARIAEAAVPAVRGEGGEQIAILVPEEVDEIRRRAPGRIGGPFGNISGVFECWLPNLDARGAIEEVLDPQADSLWGYLVTESTMDPCPYEVEDGGRVPGITQWSINDKPADVSLEDFYREWAVHSRLSFDLHPTRTSYIRNAVAREITEAAPGYLGIVLERFPRLEDFVDESIYFGDPSVVREMIEHVPKFYDFTTAITGGLAEYRWS